MALDRGVVQAGRNVVHVRQQLGECRGRRRRGRQRMVRHIVGGRQRRDVVLGQLGGGARRGALGAAAVLLRRDVPLERADVAELQQLVVHLHTQRVPHAERHGREQPLVQPLRAGQEQRQHHDRE